MAAEAVEAKSVFDDLQGSLSTHQGEMAHFARELRQVCVLGSGGHANPFVFSSDWLSSYLLFQLCQLNYITCSLMDAVLTMTVLLQLKICIFALASIVVDLF